MPHAALQSGHTAVITGAASGIGLAAAKALAGLGLNVLMADVQAEGLEAAKAEVAAVSSPAKVAAQVTDVARSEALQALARTAADAFGPVHVLMNNAGAGRNP